MNKRLQSICEKLPTKIGRAILFLPEKIQENICEIRIRNRNPVVLTLPRESLYLCRSGGVSSAFSEEVITTNYEEVFDCFLSLCNHSVYAHQNEIKEGFLSLEYGCRAGLGGRFYNGEITDVYSINIRIAREVKNCAVNLDPYLMKGLLIAGKPGSGKTTLLRDAVRILSNEKKRVCVIDTRQEISPGFDLGNFADVIIHTDKAKGMEIALRTMSPEVMVFDEIATLAELKCVNDMLNAGVRVITSAHVSSRTELEQRTVTAKLISGGAIEYIAMLGENPGDGIKVVNRREVMV